MNNSDFDFEDNFMSSQSITSAICDALTIMAAEDCLANLDRGNLITLLNLASMKSQQAEQSFYRLLKNTKRSGGAKNEF